LRAKGKDGQKDQPTVATMKGEKNSLEDQRLRISALRAGGGRERTKIQNVRPKLCHTKTAKEGRGSNAKKSLGQGRKVKGGRGASLGQKEKVS